MISIDEIVDMKVRRPTATSRDRGWGGVTVDVYGRRPNCAGSFAALDHHTISYCPSGSARLVQHRDGMVHEGSMSAALSLLIPAGYDSAWDGDAAASIRLRVPTSLVEAAGEQIGDHATAGTEIRNVFETRDSVIEHMALILVSELDRSVHPVQALLVEQISNALAAHLLRCYGQSGTARPHVPPALHQSELAQGRYAFRSNSLLTQIEALRHGYGLGMTSCFMADPDPGLVRVLQGDVGYHFDAWLVVHRDLRQAPRIRLVFDEIVRLFGEDRALFAGGG